MIYALCPNDHRIAAAPKLRGRCPICGDKVIARCGDVKIWHWAHMARVDCDDWYECETKWHRDWKAYAPPENTEVTIGSHRADIVGRDAVVIELQHSDIGQAQIIDREQFYEKMIWLIDGEAKRRHARGDYRIRRKILLVAAPPLLVGLNQAQVHSRLHDRAVRKL